MAATAARVRTALVYPRGSYEAPACQLPFIHAWWKTDERRSGRPIRRCGPQRGRLSLPDPDRRFLHQLARRSFVEALASHELLSVSPHEASTTSCLRTWRQERRLALGSFCSLGRIGRPSPSANTSEPARRVSDGGVWALRPQHGACWHDALLAISPECD